MNAHDTVNKLVHQYEDLHKSLATHVEIIARELGKPSKRSVGLLNAGCAEIRTLSQHCFQFLATLNAERVAAESQTSSHEEFIEVRRFWGPFTAQMNTFRIDLNKWNFIVPLITAQSRPKRTKLYTPESKKSALFRSQLRASDDVFSWLHSMLNPQPQSAEALENNCFPDIGLPNSVFHEHMHAAYRIRLAQQVCHPARFLDVGCGGGLKVLSALKYFELADGFDLDPVYVASAHRLNDMNPHQSFDVFTQNALTFEAYEDYDIIYFYRPISDQDLLIELEKKITTSAKPGTILVAPYKGFPDRIDKYDAQKIDGNVFVVGITPKQANTVRIRAERTGHFIISARSSPITSLWDPILLASHRNGYDMPENYKNPQY